MTRDPHQNQPVLRGGASLEEAQAAVILLHGRGASAHDILSLAQELPQQGVCFLAPQAFGSTWYPYRFIEPLERNEPYLSSALNFVNRVLNSIPVANIPREKIMLLGFSQGACLATEFAVRAAAKYGGIVGLSGGLIGPDDMSREYPGNFDQTPVFLGCSDIDPHIPKERVMETRDVFQRMGADVTMRLYPNMDHTVNRDELGYVRAMLEQLLSPPSA